MLPKASITPLDDIEFLARSEHRVTALAALARRPQSRATLIEMTGTSRSTIGRTLREFEQRQWIEKDGHQFEATQLGGFVAASMRGLIDRLETEQRLRDVWQWLPSETSGFTIEMASDAVVTVAEADDPYGPMRRFESLLRDTTTVRFLRPEVALMDLCFDLLYQRVEDGVDMTLIDRPECHTYFLSTYPNRSSTMVQRDNFTILEHDDFPPYGIGLLDDCVAISCYEQGSGTVHAVIDTDAPAVREWAESTYESYRREARPHALESVAE
ncbi:helix-turn-helix transcriptional regulator [Haloarchaeobius amylolyticus]|uniref:Helix-turn-helix transcriptional regulator n=1 Tax=Haloarchaeobius amylolyticus TaxID=1198296 RepID=A0ABD6BAZ1_9EURY